MGKFHVTGPDGSTVEVSAPEGATEAQAIQYAKDNWKELSAGKSVDNPHVSVSDVPQTSKVSPGSKESVAKVTEALKSIDDPAKLDEYKASLGLDTGIPYPELLAIEAKKRDLVDKKRTTGERIGDFASSAAGGALTNLAAVPVLGGAGKGVQMLSGLGKFEKGGDVGRALSAISEVAKAQGPKALAIEGGVLGATQQSVVDYLQEKFKMTKEAAENLAMGMMVTPAAAGKASELLPSSAKSQAREIVQKLFGGYSGKISEAQQSDLFKKISEKFGDGSTKEATKPLADAIAAATERQAAEAAAKGESRAGSLGGESSNIKKILETILPQQRETSRTTHLGQGIDPEIQGRQVKYTATQREEQLRDALNQQKSVDLPAVQNLVKSRAQLGDSVAFTPEGADVINFLEAELAPSALNEVQHGATSERFLGNILRDLKGKEAEPGATINYKGQTVTKPPNPPKEPVTPRFLSDVKSWMAGRGIDPILSRELGMSVRELPGFFAKGGGGKDDLIEAARNKGWAHENEDDATVYAKVRDIIQKELESRGGHADRPIHPGHLDEYAEWQKAHSDWDAQYGESAKHFRAAEQEAAAGGLHDPNQLPASFSVWDDKRRELREIERSGKDGGFSEVQKQLAGNAADRIETALKIYTGSNEQASGLYENYLKNYHEGMSKLDLFKNDSMGGRLTASKTKELTGKIFDSRESFLEAQDVLGYSAAQMDDMALTHISHELSNKKTTEQAEKWLSDQYWINELSPQAQAKIKAHMADLKGVDKRAVQVASRGKDVSSELANLPKETAAKVSEIKKQLLGQNKPVDHIRDLILTKRNNESEMKAIYESISTTPGGKESFQQAVKSIMREQIEGPGKKDLLKVFDERISDILVSSGTHTAAEVAELRDMAKTVDEISKANVLTREDREEAIRKVTDREFKKQTAWGILMAGIFSGSMGTGLATGNHGLAGVGAALQGAEAFGYISHGGYQRNFNRVNTAFEEILADKELFEAAKAPANSGSVQKLKSMLAQKMMKSTGLAGMQRITGLRDDSTKTKGD
jgi:hypothetical protein